MKIVTKSVINFTMVFVKNKCGHLILKTEYPGVKQKLGINSAAQKTTILIKTLTKFENLKISRFSHGKNGRGHLGMMPGKISLCHGRFSINYTYRAK